MTTEPKFMVKIRAPGEKIFYFVSGKQGLTRLRIHAIMMSKPHAEQYARELEENNPGAVAKVVPAFPEK
jgi:hypothetical protein